MALKPRKDTIGCENCKFSKGEPFKDPEDNDKTRIFCVARFTHVDTAMMSRFCDFYEIKKSEV